MSSRPTIAVSTAPLWRMRIADAFAAVRDAGGEGVEVLVTQEPTTQAASELEALSSRYGLPIVAVHAPMLLLTRRVFSSDPVQKIRRTLELCRELDTGVLVLHPPYLWQLKYTLWIMHELEEALADTKTMVTMENMYPIHVGSRRLKFHRYLSLDALAEFPHVTMDTSHLAVAELDIVDAYRRLRDRVVHVHLSDNRGRGRDSHAPLGDGVLPVEDFVRALDGPALRSIALEINPGPAAEDPARLEAVLRGSLDVVREHLPAAAH